MPAMTLTDKIWHGWLKQPYRLHKASDIGDPNAVPVIFLHGLGRSASVWRHVAELMPGKPVRMVCFDLLGFGESPKPAAIAYNADDHARAVIKSIQKLHLGQPAILVGHSMGCLISVRVARLQPQLVRHLVLYEMPLYAGLPDKRLYKLRLNLYFTLYSKVIAFKPIFKGEGKSRAQRLAERLMGFNLNDSTWRPFIRSLKHTIMEQQTHIDIKQLQMPMDVIYGTRDRLVIRGKTTEIFGDDVANVTAHTIKENHGISPKASRFIVQRIEAAIAE
jgi:cis-3-alkyl-4-acyloxetan-2-one decarboxylase